MKPQFERKFILSKPSPADTRELIKVDTKQCQECQKGTGRLASKDTCKALCAKCILAFRHRNAMASGQISMAEHFFLCTSKEVENG